MSATDNGPKGHYPGQGGTDRLEARKPQLKQLGTELYPIRMFGAEKPALGGTLPSEQH